MTRNQPNGHTSKHDLIIILLILNINMFVIKKNHLNHFYYFMLRYSFSDEFNTFTDFFKKSTLCFDVTLDFPSSLAVAQLH